MGDIASGRLAELGAILLIHGFRTGSNFLASNLEGNRLGRPQEYFNQQWQKANRDLAPDALGASAVDRILQNSVDNIFACKLPLQDLLWLAKALGDPADPIGSVARRFRRCALVVISRRDIFLQAVSLWRASVTGEWHRYRGMDGPPAAPPFDSTRIYESYQFLCRDEFLSRELVARSAMAPIVAVYEEFAEDEARLVELMNAIAERLDPERSSIRRAFAVGSDNIPQRDEFNLTYRDQFIADLLRSYTA